jgi:alpha-beta hydrolase superfamily lysophospholipase
MGCALSARFAETVDNPVALILEVPFSDFLSMAKHRAGNIPFMRMFVKYKMKTSKHIKHVAAPTLILHGTADEAIPTQQGRAVYAAAGAKNKKLIIIPDGTHRLFKFGSYEKILDWLSGLK